MSEPSTPAGVPKIFITPDGASVMAFLQAQEMGPMRLGVIRTLKKRGAKLTPDPKYADVILVNENSEDGRIFIRTWQREEDKVVLRYQWVDACVQAGKMLGPKENWGGFEAKDDGVTLEDDYGIEEEQKSPWPTPRQTESPEDPPPSTSRGTDASVDHDDIDPFHFLQALSDEMLNDPDPSLRPHGRQLQAVIPSLFDSDAGAGDVEMGPPATEGLISEKARGKQRDISKSTASRSNSVSKPSDSKSTASSPGPSAHLFVKKGRPYKFYVQADYYPRKDLVKSIRKHGGVIAGHVKEADFAILYAKASNRKEYQSSLTSAMADGIPAVKGQWVEDCISADEVLDYKPYVFVPPTKRKRTTSTQAQSAESSDDDEPLAQKAKQMKIEKPLSKTTNVAKETPSKAKVLISTPKVHARHSVSSTSRISPSKPKSTVVAKPPPQKERICYKYTEEEVRLALKLAFDYYAEDYKKTEAGLAELLYREMPHHPLRSWSTFMNQTRRKEFDEVRKKAGIQCRKRMDLAKAQQERQSRASSLAAETQGSVSRRSSVPSIEQYTPPPRPQSASIAPSQPVQNSRPPPPSAPVPTPNNTPAPRTIEQDIDTFAHFLAFQGGDEFGADESAAAYQKLATLAPWRKADEWGALWAAEWARIQPLYEQKRQQADSMQQDRDDIFGDGEISLGDRLRGY